MIDQCEINKGKERERDCEGFTPTRRQSGDGKLRDLHCARRTHRWQPNKLSVGEFFMTLSLSLSPRPIHTAHCPDKVATVAFRAFRESSDTPEIHQTISGLYRSTQKGGEGEEEEEKKKKNFSVWERKGF